MDVRAAIAQQLVSARGAKPTQGATGERGSRWVTKETGMHRDTLGRIERGLQAPTVAQARQLCALYGTRPSALAVAGHTPSKADQKWAREVIGGMTVEQLLAVAWVGGLPAAIIAAHLDGDAATRDA